MKMLAKFALSQGVEKDKILDWQKQLNQSENQKIWFYCFPSTQLI